MPIKDPQARKEYWNKWYAKNKHRLRERYRKKSKRIRERNISWMRKIKKDLSCVRCGEGHPACLEFHHKNPEEKEYNISIIASSTYSIDLIKKEMAKCIVLCSNCHRKHHYSE